MKFGTFMQFLFSFSGEASSSGVDNFLLLAGIAGMMLSLSVILSLLPKVIRTYKEK
ncbi:hypothetical protein [Cellvibrio sp. QJXJ]|uniref:hypothetical protein n=1 Tax=Cellvibrio sp. QJXJ TaxID=2964606 RepID=UPI0021C47629|nr:hypothetical protein [Cellvibrio sp. QJXJ]UUA75246.1 hypothetical protein NNX04_22590 [Cellvibrio sp. QJXJ]